MIKISIDKYFLKKTVKSESEAFEKLLYEHLGRNYSYVKINQSNVRRQNYWYDKVDNILKAFKPVFLHLYDKYGGQSKKPGEEHYMTSEEFQKLAIEANLVNDICMQRDLGLMFT